MRHISDTERRARLGRRHGLAPALRLPDPEAATRAMTVLHATEPATVYLALHARVDGLRVEDVDRVLYDDRTLVKQLAMRRTLFVFPRDLLPAAWGSASARVATALSARLAKEAVQAGLTDDGAAWLARARAATLAHLAAAGALTAAELREQVPALAGRLDTALGKPYGGSFPLAPRILGQLAVEGHIVRGHNAGSWWTSRPRWTLMRSWLGDLPAALPEGAGYAALVGRWLATFGPGTVEDLQWWLGSTKGAVRSALAEVRAVEVTLDGGTTGWVLPEDVDEVPATEPWAALLPVLDPTVMGWKSRDFYLAGHGPALFDRNGNAGTTAWWDGRVVGCWVQDPDGVVEVRLLEEVPAEGRALLEVEAQRLTEWLQGRRVSTVYPSPAMKEPR
ncbi:winged helix DNA-binding domain-containing protein [Nocardioides sp. cx-173]|uniref:winged helix DNA-binding domain-containing protein n=1 Tax=Nocardioides sp. cx-173 TaxID=2898796 RepID=UPI001E600A53|nr:winged helix DNA-binding domain-containing protein [Nocardioides sp. cx-173]MCD4524456.1 winged helix DNA-binding domain-containing protein [Nocardioides sp. cx-173]UGB43058.1 winged helix DNA-binding domain-containing protein [Nocardioides sp. cx-173]